MTISKDLAKTSWSLMMRLPFSGNFLLGLNKVESTKVPTAGVGKNGIGVQLVINPEFWNKLSEKHKSGLLEHEVSHLFFRHLEMRDRFPDKELANIAMDIEVHCYMTTEYILDGACTVDGFNTQFKLNLEKNQGTKYYYDKLLQEEQQNPKGAFAQARKNGAFGTIHMTWEEFDKLSDTEKKLISKQIEYQIKEMVKSSQKMRGLVPGQWKEYVDSLFEKVEPVIDWKAYLRRFMGSSSEVYTKKTRRKESRRFVGNPALKIKQKKHILVGVDTSGSVSSQDYDEFFNEIHHIYKTGTAISIAECDAQIHQVFQYKGKRNNARMGNGGKNCATLYSNV